MSQRELIVLGTSSQVPTRYRNHNGYLLRWDAEGFLFDPGEGTQRQMIYAEVTATAITRILITHFHGDHCLGLAGMSQRISLDRVPQTIEVHFPASGKVYYDRLRRASIYHDVSKIVARPIAGEGVIHDSKTMRIEALRLDHGVDTFGYRLVEPDSVTMLPDKLKEAGIVGRAIGEMQKTGQVEVDGVMHHAADYSVPKRGQKMAFIMDTRFCQNAIELARDVDLLVCESTYLASESREARDHGHMTATEAATIAKEAGAKKLVLTHFSQRYQSVQPFLEEARKLHDNVVAAKDGRRIPIDKRVVPTKRS